MRSFFQILFCFIILSCECPIPLPPLIKNSNFMPLNCFCLFIMIGWAYSCGSVYGISTVSLIYMSIPLIIPYILSL